MRKVPELRFDGFYGEWEEKKFSKNFDTTIPKNSLSRDKLTNQVTKVKNIHYGDIHKIFDNIIQSSDEKIPYIINDDLSTHERYFLQDGDIIFTDAAEDNTAGKCVELDIDDGSDIVSGLHTIPARPIKFGKYFYGFYLNSNSFHNKIIPLLEGTKVSSISKSNLNTLSVIVPKVEEQEKIGGLFRKIDYLIEIQEGKVSKMEDFKKSMLQKMFPKKDELVPEFRFDGFDGEWKENKLSEIGDTYTSLSGKTAEDFGHGEASYVTYMNVYKNSIADINDLGNIEIDNKQNEVLNGDFFFTTSSETPEEVGLSSAWIYDKSNVYLNSFCFGFRPIININTSFFAYFFRSEYFRRKVVMLAQGSTRFNISKKYMMDILVRYPSLEEQEKIGQFFKNLDAKIENEEKLLESYKMMKKSLLQKMFV
ncbi:MAG: restriction endonuclease subunit S [Anaerococcus vaginalis]|uniref:restriction endonuclease subunit S n=1 Tax=Anaerococcus vaginalis TaxID=33037 RepID=UPI00290B2B00|nr:restriction endonuclease subunit S [Anaerococcus vaginalis]MDU7650704.1 restriction endonuclease subunit S [Anaerococcus vaginalis]